MRENLPESPVTLDEYAKLSQAERRDIWLQISDISEAEFDAHIAEQKAREAKVPQPGDMAPDFTADVLGPNRTRTGEQVKLSALRGKPVGLVFGSFT